MFFDGVLTAREGVLVDLALSIVKSGKQALSWAGEVNESLTSVSWYPS